MNSDFYLILPVFFPILAGIAAFFAGRRLPGKKALHAFVWGCLAVELVLVWFCILSGGSCVLWNLTEDLQISFAVDTISRVFSGLISIVWVLVGTYSFEYLSHGEHESRFFGFYLIVEGAVMGLCFADNLIAFYIFFELMTFTSMPLVLHEMTHSAIMAGLKYMFYSIAGAFMALFGIFFLSPYGSLGSFAAGGNLDSAALAGHENLLLACAFLMILGFGTKAGMFPMHGWLPTAHPEAPAPASAVLSGAITKMGVLGTVRAVFYVVGPDRIRGTWVQMVWLTLTLITVFLGSMMAYKEKVTKKRLAYSTVSQVSYILFGLACLYPVAFVGAILHVIFHSLIKTTLFLCSGAFITQLGKRRVEQLTGAGKEMPIVLWCFTLVSIGLIGIPPTGGFISKWYLAMGSLNAGTGFFTWLGPVVLLVSALLTAGYLLPITIRGFFPGEDYDYAALTRKEPTWRMTVPMILMTTGAFVFGMFPGVLASVIEAAAAVIF